MMSNLRIGNIPDMDAICDLGRELLADSVYSGLKADDQRFRTFVAGLMGLQTATVLVVVDDDDKPQGFLIGMIDDLFFSRSRYGTDLAFYIREGYRYAAPAMINKFIEWAKSKPRVKYIQLGISSGTGNPERIGRMYEKLGLKRVGGLYHMGV